MKLKDGRDFLKLDGCVASFDPETSVISLSDWETIEITLDELYKIVKFVENKQKETK